MTTQYQARHPSYHMGYYYLNNRLREEIANGNVSEVKGPDGLSLYCYTRQCAYNRNWNPTTRVARGLILDHEAQEIRATPFPKFFNYGEIGHDDIPRGVPFRVYEKVDGSMVTVFQHKGRWLTATKGSFQSDQAKWAADQLAECKAGNHLVPGTTYVMEAVYPENRIVVKYNFSGLVLLGAFARDGHEWDYKDVAALSKKLGCWYAEEIPSHSCLDHLTVKAASLGADQEGWVVRFDDGYRLKIKGDEYCRLHRLVSRVTPLAVWEAVKNGESETTLQEIPEEFRADFCAIRSLLFVRAGVIYDGLNRLNQETKGWTDKELGLKLDELDPQLRKLIFPYRKGGGRLSGPALDSLYNMIRPTGNVLEGYTPSTAMNRFQEAKDE